MKTSRGLGSRNVRTLVVAVVAAVVIGGALTACSGDGSAVPPADGFGPGDGLNRFVVSLVDQDAVPQGAGSADDAMSTDGATDGAASGTGATVPDGRGYGRIDTALLSRAHAELGAGGQVLAYGYDPYYVTDAGAMLVGPGGDGSVVELALVGHDGSAGSDGSAGPAQAADGGADGADGADGAAPGPASDSGAAALASLAARPGVVSAQWLSDGTVLLAGSLTEADVAALPEVASVSPSVQVSVLGDASGDALVPTSGTAFNDPFLGAYGWNLRNTGSNAYQQTAVAGADVDAPTAWTVTQGQGAVVAVVDTGFDSDHPDLVGSLWTNPSEPCGSVDTDGNGKPGDCHGWNFMTNSADIDNGANGSHGTAVSGVIGARANNNEGSAGVAPQVSLMPLVVGSGSTVDVYLAAEAIRYAADHGADAVNASFGGTFTGPALTSLSSAVDYAISKGVVVVAAAGNDAANRDSSPVYPANLTNPALLTVASTTATDGLAGSSAYGAAAVDLGAPGEKIVTTWNDGGYRLVSGTSFAAPHVAAAAALHRSLRDRTPAEVRAVLLEDAEPVVALAGRTVSGGRLDVGPLADTGASTTYAFSGMVGQPGTQTPVVEVSSVAPAGTYAVTLGLAMRVDGQVWAVAGEDITLDGVAAVTDEVGTATFALGSLPGLGSRTFSPVLTLGAGEFALTVQVFRDGDGLTRPFAAPLVVSAAAPDPGSGGGTDPGAGGGTDPGAGGGTDPGAGGGTDPGAGGGTPPGSGDTTPPATDDPTTPGTGGTGTPGTKTPGTSGGTKPPGTDGGSTDPGTGGGSTDPGTGGGGTTDPSTGGGTGPGTGGGTQPGGGSGEPGTGADPGTGTDPGAGTGPGTGGGGSTDPSTGGGSGPSGPDVAQYDRVGDFAVTQLSPVHVPATGGSLVSVRGDALEPGVSVRVGATGTATVLLSTDWITVFLTPERVPGVYDVTISRLGRSSVLTDALVYMAAGGSDGTTSPGSGGGDPSPGGSTPDAGQGIDPGTGGGSDPGTGGGSDPGTGGSSNPGGSNPGGSNPGGSNPGGSNPGGSDPGGSDPGSGGGSDPGGADPGDGGGGATGPQPQAGTRVGPNGERLVRYDALAPLANLWSLQCSTRCSGIQL